jgi:adenosylcobinamide-GDP ribazoletransferase
MRFILALTFLTIVPFPRKGTTYSELDFGRATAYFPLIGLMLGVTLYLAYELIGTVWSALTAHVFITFTWVLLTGGLHLDGLADIVDGFFGGLTQEERLAIMKDSRVGVFGVIALIFCLLLKIAFLGELQGQALSHALILAPILGRWAMVLSIQFMPAARSEGMGHSIKQHSSWQELVIATIMTVGFTLLLEGWRGLAICVLLAFAVALLGWSITRRLGGMTGDTYGALCELSELVVLLLLGMIPILRLP